MNLYPLPPSCSRVVTAVDECVTNHPPTGAPRSSAARLSSISHFRILAAAVALACCVPAITWAQHSRGSYHGHSSQAQLSTLFCSSGSLTGAGTDACTVKLTQSASSGGFTVNLKSSSSAVNVPASVTVSSGSSSIGFKATASAVTSTQTAMLTATGSNNSETYSLQLKPGSTGTAALTLGSSSVAFGSVKLNTPATQTVQLTSSGTSAVTISAASVKGTGFSMSGVTMPVTLSAGQSATLNLQFDPTAAGADTGTVTITSNATSGGTATIALSGTGTTAGGYQVELKWAAPGSSGDAVNGYNVYRAASGGSYQKLNTSVNQPTAFTDTSVQSGTTYTYQVMSVDASGVQSAASNAYSAAIP